MQINHFKHNLVSIKIIKNLVFLFFCTIVSYAQTPCEFGLSANFPCNNVEFVGQVTLAEFGSANGNDCWGWTDPQTGKEWAIMGMIDRTGFVDISDPTNPLLKMTLPSTGLTTSTWRDIKVYNNYAFIVSEDPTHGMQIFDLTHLREVNPIPFEDAHFSGFGSSHNIAINEDTGYAYSIGGDTFQGGPHFINIQNPLNPIDEGGYSDDGYTHDAQIITYNGPDTDYTGKEIFIGANEDSVVIVDVTDKVAPIKISEIFYSNIGYTHQVWFDENHKYLYVGDELDELNSGIPTRTLVFNLSDLDNPIPQLEYSGPTPAIDHNNYTHNNKLYLANYNAGLRIIDISDIENNNMTEIGFFDTFPPNNNVDFSGAWSVYPYFASGNIIVSDIEAGLIIVRENVTNLPPPVVNFPNDCSNNIVVCGNAEINLDVDGIGDIQEIDSANACSGQETNSLWLKVTVEDAGIDGTLGFTLTPESTDIGEDYDFWVFGPNVDCDNLGTAIRCSTTNPAAAAQGNNLTGMNGSVVDLSEGPGADGDSFVQWLNVNAGETYFIILDRPIGDSAFTLDWTGTATFAEPPTSFLSPSFTLNQELCDFNNDGIENFNLTSLENLVVNLQDVTVSYYDSLLLAEINQNPISNPNGFTASTGTTTVYMRLTDNVTECFTILDMELLLKSVSINQPPNLKECDLDNDGFAAFDLRQQDILISGVANNPELSYFYQTGGGPVFITNPDVYENRFEGQQTIFARLNDPSINCFADVFFQIEVFETPIANPILDWFVCDNDDENVGFFNFDLETLNEQVLFDQDEAQFLITYHNSQQDADSNTNTLPLIYTNQFALTQETIYVRIENKDNSDCFNTTFFEINVFENPIFDLDLVAYFCTNISNYSVDLIVTTLGDYDYLWTDSNGFTLPGSSNQNTYTATSPGNYTVTITTKDGNSCSVIRTINVLPSEPAEITNVLVNELETGSFSLEVEFTGLGLYDFSLDDENGPYQDEPLFLNIPEGIHEIFVREKSGCGIVSIEVAVFSFPKFFTPNGDGDNEFWKTGLTFQPNAKITIFDRYGKIMTQIIPSLNQAWDGLYKNNPAPQSDYWFIAELINDKGESVFKKGHFSLIRI